MLKPRPVRDRDPWSEHGQLYRITDNILYRMDWVADDWIVVPEADMVSPKELRHEAMQLEAEGRHYTALLLRKAAGEIEKLTAPQPQADGAP